MNVTDKMKKYKERLEETYQQVKTDLETSLSTAMNEVKEENKAILEKAAADTKDASDAQQEFSKTVTEKIDELTES